MSKPVMVLVALYRYRNFPIRIMHPVLKGIDGIEVHTIFFKDCETNDFVDPTNRELELFAQLITKLNPQLVGFSVLSPYVPIARRLTKLVKEHSSALVIWGGIHPTIAPDSCMEEADLVCVGEGEGAFTELATHLRDGTSYEEVQNLWVRKGDQIIKNPMRPLIQDLDSLPFASYGDPSFHFVDADKITNEDPSFFDKVFWLQASRGCPYVCSFCVNAILQPLFKGLGAYTRRRSPKNIVQELKENLNLPGSPTRSVLFIDEVFGCAEAWLDEFSQLYKQEIGLPFFAEYNPEVINPKMLEKLAVAGLDTINFGIQTGDDFIRNKIFDRPGKNSDIINIVKAISKHRVKIRYDLIIDNPYENADTLEKTIEMLVQLPKPLMFNLYSMQYFPKYPFTERALKDQYVLPKEVNVETLFDRTTNNWAFVPRLRPWTRKQRLQNIIWMIVWNHVKDDLVSFAVFGKSWRSKVCFYYLSFISIPMGKIVGVGGMVMRHRWMDYALNGIKYLLRGELKPLCGKIGKVIVNTFNEKKKRFILPGQVLSFDRTS